MKAQNPTHNGIFKTVTIQNESLRLFNFLTPMHDKGV